MRCFSTFLVLTISFTLFADSAYQYPEWVTDEMKENIPEIELRGILSSYESNYIKYKDNSELQENINQLYMRRARNRMEYYKNSPQLLSYNKEYYKKLDLDLDKVDFYKAPHPPWVTSEMIEKIPLHALQAYYMRFYTGTDVETVQNSGLYLLKPENEHLLRDHQLAATDQNAFRYRTMQIVAQENEKQKQFIYLMPNYLSYYLYWSQSASNTLSALGKDGHDVYFTINPRFESIVMTIWSRKKPIIMPQVEWDGDSTWANVSWLDRCKIGALICTICEIEKRATNTITKNGYFFVGCDLEVVPDDMETVNHLIREMIRMASTEPRNQAQVLFRTLCREALKQWGTQGWKWDKPKELLEYNQKLVNSDNSSSIQSNKDFWPERPERPYRDEDWKKITGKGRDVVDFLKEKSQQSNSNISVNSSIDIIQKNDVASQGKTTNNETASSLTK